MAIKSLNPYLNFNGTAAKAIAHYEKALGAKTTSVMRFSDAPGDFGADVKDRIMHAALEIDGAILMVSDSMPGQPVTAGDNVNITLNFEDTVEMARKFEALGAGGKVTQALQDTFWDARYGSLVDAFGIHWMFNCQIAKKM
jgi:PhnB protein